jgi:hypothetical protein
MLGGFGVGKTSLVSRFVSSMFSDKYLTTVGVKVDKKTVQAGGQDVTAVADLLAAVHKPKCKEVTVLLDVEPLELPGELLPSGFDASELKKLFATNWELSVARAVRTAVGCSHRAPAVAGSKTVSYAVAWFALMTAGVNVTFAGSPCTSTRSFPRRSASLAPRFSASRIQASRSSYTSIGPARLHAIWALFPPTAKAISRWIRNRFPTDAC